MTASTLLRPSDPTTPAAGSRTSLLGRLGGWCFDHRWRAVGLWAVVLVAILGAAAAVGPAFGSSAEVPGSDSTAGVAVLDEHFPALGAGGRSGSIVIRSDRGVDDPAVVAALEVLFATVDAGFPDAQGVPQAPGATILSPFADGAEGQIARDGPLADRLAVAHVNLAADVDDIESGRIGALIAESAPELDGLEVVVGGQYLATIEPPATELIGIAFAIVVLIVSFGSVLAMGLPIAVALGGVAAGVGSIAVLSQILTVPEDTTVLGLMIGLGVGIDYALFIVTRYRDAVHEGATAREATVLAMSTAGRAVVVAGLTVVISMLGLLVVGLGWLSGMGVGVSMTVLATMLTSLTLLPALLGVGHERLELTRWRGLVAAGFVAVALLGAGVGSAAVAAGGALLAAGTLVASIGVGALRRPVPRRRARPADEVWAHRWSRIVQRRPAAWLGAATLVLAVLAAPVAGMRLAWTDEGQFPEGTSTRRAHDLITEGFGPGVNGPFLVTATLGSAGDRATVDDLHATLAATPGVAGVTPPQFDDPEAPRAALMTLVPTTGPQDAATTDLVRTLREDVAPTAVAGSGVDVHVTGSAAVGIDVTDYLGDRMPVFFAAVLGVSFVVLMMVFRSVLVPLKAVLMNVMSIAAAYGVVVAVFQWGWGASMLGIAPGPINPFIPLMLFAIVFGLSMDYEVFMLSRIREEFERTGDPVASVADGLASTARVITAAAAIMVVVFGSFVFEEVREIQLFGLGLALAVLIDATLVRMVVVPSTMALLGARNWWMPRWLDRLLPRLDVEARPQAA